MSNIFGLESFNKKDEEKDDDANRLYVGGASSHGGGSGLSVIGGDGNPSGAVENIIANAQSQSQERGASDGPPEGSNIITFYRNGFTVDNGPLRSFTDPENKPFLNAVEKGYVPRELERESNEQVHISLMDKRGEDFRPPTPPRYTAFAGEGQTMGSTTTAAVVSSSGVGSVRPVVDASQPTTTIQIRLHNGKRLREKLNLSHTIQDIQTIIHLETQADATPYALLAGYPPQPLTDMSLTLEAAKLQGAAITQKLA